MNFLTKRRRDCSSLDENNERSIEIMKSDLQSNEQIGSFAEKRSLDWNHNQWWWLSFIAQYWSDLKRKTTQWSKGKDIQWRKRIYCLFNWRRWRIFEEQRREALGTNVITNDAKFHSQDRQCSHQLWNEIAKQIGTSVCLWFNVKFFRTFRTIRFSMGKKDFHRVQFSRRIEKKCSPLKFFVDQHIQTGTTSFSNVHRFKFNWSSNESKS